MYKISLPWVIVRVSLLYFNDTDYNIIETCLIVECVRFLYVERRLTKSNTTVIRYFCNGRYVSKFNNEKKKSQTPEYFRNVWIYAPNLINLIKAIASYFSGACKGGNRDVRLNNCCHKRMRHFCLYWSFVTPAPFYSRV